MQFNFKSMNHDYAQAIANWHYAGIYSFYDMDQDLADQEEMLDSRNWTGQYYAVVDKRGELVGFFCCEQEDEAMIIGLGLNPDYTGKGVGQAFVEAGLTFLQHKFNPTTFHLSVATFNQRAISVYEKVGFKVVGSFMNETNGSQYEFLRMVREGKKAVAESEERKRW